MLITKFNSARLTLIAASVAALLGASLAHAENPGRGATAEFEKNYLTFIIDHHYSALRMTELAAGTDVKRDAAVQNLEEGTSPTPKTSASPAKAHSDKIKSMARQANRMQREEILTAQRMLLEFYAVTHAPELPKEAQSLIQILEQAPPGSRFDRTFLKTFSDHHYAALQPSQDCRVKSDISHDSLIHYCEGIVENQTRDINEMRKDLCSDFSDCDFQPGAARRRH